MGVQYIEYLGHHPVDVVVHHDMVGQGASSLYLLTPLLQTPGHLLVALTATGKALGLEVDGWR